MVWVGPDPPVDPLTEMWWDTDEDIPLDARYATKASVDATTPLRGGMSSPASGAVTTSGTTEVMLATSTPTLNEPGRVFVSAAVNVVQSVSTDAFQVNLKCVTTGVTLSALQGTGSRWGVAPNGMITLPDPGPYEFEVSIFRTSGTGTATVSAGAFCRMTHIILRGATG